MLRAFFMTVLSWILYSRKGRFNRIISLVFENTLPLNAEAYLQNRHFTGFAKIILPAEVCSTLVTSMAMSLPMRLFPFSTTTMVPSS